MALTQEEFNDTLHDAVVCEEDLDGDYFERVRNAYSEALSVIASQAAQIERVKNRLVENRTLVLQHVGSISFDNATVVRDTEGNPIAAFWSASTANNYVDLQTADESIGRLTDERDSARLKCVALQQELKRVKGGWIPCEERLPEEDELVLIWFTEDRRKGLCRARIGFVVRGHWRPEGGNGNFDNEVTHWQPLPSAPSTVAAEAHL